MLLLFNFQWSTRLSSSPWTAYILYHISSRLSSTFSKVFLIFSKFFSNQLFKQAFRVVSASFLKAPVYYTTNRPFCQGVFQKFFEIFQSFFRDASRRPPESTFQFSLKFWRISLKLRCFILPWYSLSCALKRFSSNLSSPGTSRCLSGLPFIGFIYISCAFLPDSLYIIPQTLSFVKGFFESFFVFLSFFCVFLLPIKHSVISSRFLFILYGKSGTVSRSASIYYLIIFSPSKKNTP